MKTVKIIRGRDEGKVASVITSGSGFLVLETEGGERLWARESEATQYYMPEPPREPVHSKEGGKERKSLSRALGRHPLFH